jgi:hypothetical protein
LKHQEKHTQWALSHLRRPEFPSPIQLRATSGTNMCSALAEIKVTMKVPTETKHVCREIIVYMGNYQEKTSATAINVCNNSIS